MTMQLHANAYRPAMTRAGLDPTHPVQAIDEFAGLGIPHAG